jgi:hypothetical protein
MSNKITIVISINSDSVSRFLFDDYISACHDAGLMVRYEPYTRDMYAELNDKALDIERQDALASLENEILNKTCINGTCED